MAENPLKALFSEYFKDGVSLAQRLCESKFVIEKDFVQKEIEQKRRTRTKKHITSLCNVVRYSLDEKYCRISSPGLKLSLFPHQETALAAMLELEHKRVMTFRDGTKIAYNAAVYSDPPGVGKTITVLALIKLSPTPRLYPDINILPTDGLKKDFVSAIRTRYKTILNPTLIFMGSSVIKQWEQMIEQFTDLKYFSVYTIKELRKLLEMMAQSSLNPASGINMYDIVLVKNGRITRKLDELPLGIHLNSCNEGVVSYIYNVLANMNMVFKRCVMDDFDTVVLPDNATTLLANFTWLISSTRKTAREYTGEKYENKVTTAGQLSTIKYGCGNLVRNSVLFQLLNVRNNIPYICDTARQNIIKYHLVRSKNHAAAVINMIGDLKSDEKFMEMLNGDAFKQAANAVGLSKQPIVNIFISILGNRYKDFRGADVALKRATDIENILDVLPDVPDGHKKTFSKKEFLSLVVPEYRYANLKSLIHEIRVEYTAIYNESGKAIERTKANLREGECIICFTTFKNAEGIIINKCCCSAFCSTCGYTMQKFADRFQGKGTCAKCRSDLSIKDLIYIDKNFDIEAILNNQFEDENANEDADADADGDEKKNSESDIKIEAADEDGDVLPEDYDVVDEMVQLMDERISFAFRPHNDESQTTRAEWLRRIKEYKSAHTEQPKDKYEYATNIIFGNTEPCKSERFDVSIMNISQGAHYTPEPEIRKVLIFANFEETLGNVKTALNAEKIIFWELCGGYRELMNIANSFTACNQPCALVINSTLRCSGLNLQTATDLVFMHKIIDSNVETQVIGRGHRIGRTSSLNVWYNLYEEEVTDMQRKYNMRFLQAKELEEEKEFEDGKKTHVINSVQGADNENEHAATIVKKSKRADSKKPSDDDVVPNDDEPPVKTKSRRADMKKTKSRRADMKAADVEPPVKKSKAADDSGPTVIKLPRKKYEDVHVDSDNDEELDEDSEAEDVKTGGDPGASVRTAEESALYNRIKQNEELFIDCARQLEADDNFIEFVLNGMYWPLAYEEYRYDEYKKLLDKVSRVF